MNSVTFRQRKRSGPKLSVITCYDYPFARCAAATEVEALLVGDSVAMAVHGHPNTLHADLPMMELHTKAVARGAGEKLIIADLPFLEHRKGLTVAVTAAQCLLRAGAQAIKLEGAVGNLETIRHLVESGVPVMGHVGLTPQFVHAFGGFKVQGREAAAAERIVADARALEEAGVFALVAEGVPSALGKQLAEVTDVPVIGIGAGPDTDGQVLVLQDLLGFTANPPKLARAFAALGKASAEGIAAYVTAVRDGSFPTAAESYR